MNLIANALTLLVGLAHIGFLVLEMFLWTGPIGQRVFGMSPAFAAQTAVIAANQGLYNGILAAGLLWGVFAAKRDVKIFFLLSVVVAGIYGGITAKTTILYIQAAPGALALLAVLLSKPRTV